jgi:uncharacterized damage-inducible protein DinB
LLVHVAVAPRFQTHVHRSGIVDLKTVNFMEVVQAALAEEAKGRGKAEVIELLTSEGELVAAFLETASDALLAERVATPPGPGASKSRFEMLLSMKEHEMHHRGQLMLIERMLGITPHLTRQMQERFAARR